MAGLRAPEALRADHDRETFDCGRESLNVWLRRHAWRNQQTGVSRTSVICGAESGAVAGFVSLSAAQIARAALPRAAQRNQPDPIPALLLGQLAVDMRHKGSGCARALLVFALNTAVRFSREIGCFGVITHPLDDGVRGFYTRFGFETLPFDPGRAMAVRIADLERSGFPLG